MKNILAIALRCLFRFKFFKSKFYFIHNKLILPNNLFGGVIRKIRYNDLQIELHIDDWIQENLYFLGEYEVAELKTMKQFLTYDSVFIDIGANIGLYALNASKILDENAQIICFEPFQKNFNSLAKNIALNGLSNVQLEKKAIGDKDGTINLYYNEEEMNLGMVSTKPLEKGITEKVTLVSLDSYLKDHPVPRIDLIKIDIEGFEYSALLGMKNTLTAFQPSILIEILDGNDSDSQNLKCYEFLLDLGYNKYFIDDHGNLSEKEVNPSRMNYVFTTKRFANIKKGD